MGGWDVKNRSTANYHLSKQHATEAWYSPFLPFKPDQMLFVNLQRIVMAGIALVGVSTVILCLSIQN